MGVEGTKREGKGGGKIVIHEEFFSCLWKKKSSKIINHQTLDTERGVGWGMMTWRAAFWCEMQRRDWQEWYGLVKREEGRVKREKERAKKIGKTKFPSFPSISLINIRNCTPGRWRNRWGGKWRRERLYEKMKHLPALRWGIRKI